MNHLSLFSGIGGIDLAAEWAGIKTVAFCERDKFCRKVLAKHWPDVPIYDDVCRLTYEQLCADGIDRIDIISGGFPCQPFSIAGKRMGNEDNRFLWPEFKRLIEECRPSWVVGENVIGIVDLALDDVLADLESIGYTARAFDIPAGAVGADHQRRRIFIVAYADCVGCEGRSEKTLLPKQGLPSQLKGMAPDVLRRSDIRSSKLCRGTDGVPNRLARVRALGNAVVPQQIYPIFEAIMRIAA